MLRPLYRISTSLVFTGPPAPSYLDTPLDQRGKIVVLTSGKGGVGKSTTSANLGLGLSYRGKKVCVVDFDCGQRNLDLFLGLERRIVYDLVNCIEDKCSVQQALIKDKRQPNLSLLAASQTRDKSALTQKGVERVLSELVKDFDYVLLDSPAGIEAGSIHALYHADESIIVVNPEIASISDSDRVIGIIESRSRRAALSHHNPLGPEETLDTTKNEPESSPDTNKASPKRVEPVKQYLLINRYSPERVENETSLSYDAVTEMLGIPLLGIIPESPDDILASSNRGEPVISAIYNNGQSTKAAEAFNDSVSRLLGEDIPLRFLDPEKKGFFSTLFS